jgi:hypothetical protein
MRTPRDKLSLIHGKNVLQYDLIIIIIIIIIINPMEQSPS